MKNTLKNSLKVNLIITIVTSILSFLSNKYFSKYMGVETLGLMRLFTQIIAYLNLADMGIGTASAYALYKPLAEKNTEQIDIVVSTIDFFYKRIALIILLAGLSVNFFLHMLIKTESYGEMLYVYWSLYVLNTSISYVYAKYPIIFTANQEYQKVRVIQGTGRTIFQSIQILFLIKIQSFFLFILILSLENIYLFILYKKHYIKNYNFIKKVKETDKKIMKDTKNLFWHKLGSVIVFNTDYIVLSKFTSLFTIGVYSSYLIIYQMMMVLIGIISSVLSPIIGKFVAENSEDKIYSKWNELYMTFFYISTFLVICTYNLIVPFVKLWLGDEYILSNLTVVLILINLFIQMTRGVTETFKIASGFFDDTYAPFLEGGLNLIFSIILVQKIGLNGVIIGTIISNIVVILILKPILVFKRCFNRPPVEYIKVSSYYFLLAGISIIFSQLIIQKINLLNIVTWKMWIYKSILVGFISLIIVSIVFFVNKDFRIISRKIIKNL